MTTGHPFADWAGTWRGEGRGSYPTIADFDYLEELTITPVAGRPVAHWASRTRDAVSGEPRHAESGFLRGDPEKLELVLAHSFGLLEAATGGRAGGVVRLGCGPLPGSPGTKQVDAVRRSYEFAGDDLTYRIEMAAVGHPLTHHLAAELHRS